MKITFIILLSFVTGFFAAVLSVKAKPVNEKSENLPASLSDDQINEIALKMQAIKLNNKNNWDLSGYKNMVKTMKLNSADYTRFLKILNTAEGKWTKSDLDFVTELMQRK